MGSVPRMTKPYRAAMRGKWTEVKSFYDKHNELLHTPLTAAGDTALHIAVYIVKTDLLEALLQKLKSESEDFPFNIEGYSPYQVKNEHGHTPLHLAAAAGNLPALKLLLDYDVELLNVQNNREETALFRAAAFGRTKVVRNLASRIHDKGPHLRRKDSTSILHIAILGKYFETAVELLKWGVSPYMVDENGMTGFQLLANMPSAFKSGYRMGKLKALLYYCLPDVEYAENFDKEIDPEPHVMSCQNVDIESGNAKKYLQPSSQPAERPSVVSRVYNAFWRCVARGFPIIKELWRDKKKHTKVLELTKILAETDFSWKSGHSGGAPNEKISTLRDDEEDIGGGEKQEDEDASDERPPPKAASSSSFLYETPFIAAARNGILEIVQAILHVYPQAY
ncbi:uncharacterized protein LOC112490403 isoform X1 [Ziziphus jujuba]|uniref:Uncharacterized protein LOC112490403 isoform X1 n=1 Tax=Ziziphus jujuba TaxID=326968 RepID=A0ABM3IUH8_ZIZJJ|nr:uncharacterized protein LOC112490403 isoform X1 [Ziziphus jujuba]